MSRALVMTIYFLSHSGVRYWLVTEPIPLQEETQNQLRSRERT
jgi:hypothetical protein